ncbi:hypothetical protein GTY54_02020, partial [Streptomyces sp. SID625]|nr:hypothetical protein [Streptomyces sp. SID625]
HGADGPAGLECTVEEVAGTGAPGGFRTRAALEADEYGDEDIVAGRVTVPAPGLYRVVLDSGDGTPLTQLVLAGAEPEDGPGLTD